MDPRTLPVARYSLVSSVYVLASSSGSPPTTTDARLTLEPAGLPGSKANRTPEVSGHRPSSAGQALTCWSKVGERLRQEQKNKAR